MLLKMSKRFYYTALVLMMLSLFVIFAPGFLFTEDVTRNADAVVLFVGPGNEARRYEAEQLIREGSARYLLIPSSGEIFTADSGGGLLRMAGVPPKGDYAHWNSIKGDYRKHFENTHIEALEAKLTMDGLGLRSAIMVSSGYHMRRIRLIAGRVFSDNKYSIYCNPAKWQTEYTAADWQNREYRKKIVSEYVKIGWFMFYGAFS